MVHLWWLLLKELLTQIVKTPSSDWFVQNQVFGNSNDQYCETRLENSHGEYCELVLKMYPGKYKSGVNVREKDLAL